MATYFSNKISDIRQQIDENKQPLSELPALPVTSNDAIPVMSEFNAITSGSLFKIIQSMNNKSSSADPIPTSVLKQNITQLLPILLEIVNKSLLQGVFPDQLKEAIINPIYKSKSNDSEKLKNYRPVSNIQFLSKLLEKVAMSQINDHLSQHQLYPQHQSGYQKKHSCETALCKITNDIQQHLYNDKMVVLVLLDLSSAFDTVDHSILLDMLQSKFKITGSVFEWLKSYLKGRKFVVKIGTVNGKKSLTDLWIATRLHSRTSTVYLVPL